MKRIFLDNNMWDYFYENKINLAYYFPKNKFDLYITKHGRYEIDQMPSDKEAFKNFIYSQLSDHVSEDHIFGFPSDQIPANEQRISGFGMGRFTTCEENQTREYLHKKFGNNTKRKPRNILFKQEADIELGVLSMTSIVLSFDGKKGPLREASKCGGKVIFLSKKESEEIPTATFMNNLLSEITKTWNHFCSIKHHTTKQYKQLK